jgi:hypothetical protein
MEHGPRAVLVSTIAAAAAIGGALIIAPMTPNQKPQKSFQAVWICLPRQDCMNLAGSELQAVSDQAKSVLQNGGQFSDSVPYDERPIDRKITSVQDAIAVVDAIVKQGGGMTSEGVPSPKETAEVLP